MTAKRIRIALLVLLATQLVAIGAFWAWELPLPHQVEIGEAPVLTVVLFSKAGRPLYTEPAGLPLLQNPYGPVFEWLCARFPVKASQPYLVGRAISIGAILGLGVLVAVWLRRRGARWFEVFVALALFLTTKPWILFGPLYRVDTLAVLLSVLGFLLAISERRAFAAASLPVFILASCVKLTALAAPVAAVAYLWSSQRRRSLWLLGALVILLPGSVLALQWATDGAYLLNASLGNEPSRWLKAIELPSRISLSLFWLLAAGVAVRRVTLKGASETRALLLYSLASLLVAALFATNPLSSWNYLMEFYVALALLTGLLLARSRREREIENQRPPRVLQLLAVHAVLGLLIAAQAISKTGRSIRDYQARYERAYERIEPLVRQGHTVLVLDSPEGKDVLNALGKPNAVSVPRSVERRHEIQELIQRSLDHSQVDVVLVGPSLESRVRGAKSPPAAD